VTLYRDYFATDSQKIKLQDVLYQNQRSREEANKEKYDVENIFTNNKNENGVKIDNTTDYTKNVSLVVYKDNIFTKIGKFLKKIFNVKV